MDAPGRMRAAGAAVAAGHLAAGAFSRLVLGVPGAMLFFGLCAVLSLAVALAAAPRLRPPPPHRGGEGGEPQPPEPPWWPEFERELRAWAARDRAGA